MNITIRLCHIEKLKIQIIMENWMKNKKIIGLSNMDEKKVQRIDLKIINNLKQKIMRQIFKLNKYLIM